VVWALCPTLKVVCDLNAVVGLKPWQTFWHHLVGHGAALRHVPKSIGPAPAATGGTEQRGGHSQLALILHKHPQAASVELVLAGQLGTAG